MREAINGQLQWFEYSHLPEHLQKVSIKFHNLAHELVEDFLGDNRETTKFLDRLLEAKDAAIRSFMMEKQ